MDSLTIIRQYLVERLRIDPQRVTREALLKDLSVDSLIMLDMMFDLEDALDIVLPKELPVVHTVGELIVLLETLKLATRT